MITMAVVTIEKNCNDKKEINSISFLTLFFLAKENLFR
jgi:hypothetical protein